MALSYVAHSILPSKRLRRSPRFEAINVSAECETTRPAFSLNGPLGYLETLPLELKFAIFDYLSVTDVSLLSITSKATRDIVELYRDSRRGRCSFMPRPLEHSNLANEIYYLTQFQKLGLLWKRSTCLYSTKDRLKQVFDFMMQYVCQYKDCHTPSHCLAYSCLGELLRVVLAGWDDRECTRAFDTLTTGFRFAKQLQTITTCRHGSMPAVEMHTRLFYRHVFLSTRNKIEYAFWLNLILRPFAMVHQARILYLLFGPLSPDGKRVEWHVMCELSPSTPQQADVMFSDLAGAFHMLHYFNKEWSEDAIVSVVDELSSCPDGWLSDNMAQLLFFCGDTIASKVLNSKAINGRIADLASIIGSLCQVCVRNTESIKWVMNIIHDILLIFGVECVRRQFIDAVIDAFRDALLDIISFGDTEEERQDMLVVLDAQSQFFKEVYALRCK